MCFLTFHFRLTENREKIVSLKTGSLKWKSISLLAKKKFLKFGERNCYEKEKLPNGKKEKDI